MSAIILLMSIITMLGNLSRTPAFQSMNGYQRENWPCESPVQEQTCPYHIWGTAENLPLSSACHRELKWHPFKFSVSHLSLSLICGCVSKQPWTRIFYWNVALCLLLFVEITVVSTFEIKSKLSASPLYAWGDSAGWHQAQVVFIVTALLEISNYCQFKIFV